MKKQETIETVETAAGLVSVGTRIRVKPVALGESGEGLREVGVLEIWPSGRMMTDEAIDGTPFGSMPIMVQPESVVEIVTPEDGPRASRR